MKKLLFAASALTLAVAMSPAVTSAVQAAPTKSPYCDMAKSQKNLVAWNAYYHCLGEAPRVSRTATRAKPQRPHDPYCDMAKSQKNLVAWNAYYHCLGPAPRAPRASLQGRRLYAQAQPAQAKDPYCDMAKTQKNLVSWNAYYHCLSR